MTLTCRCMAIVCVFFLTGPGLAQQQEPREHVLSAATGISTFESVAPGMEFRQVRLEKPRTLLMSQLRCDPEKVRFSLLLASDGQRKARLGRAEEIATRFGQLAVINCSYFDQQDQILGYHERLGHVLQPSHAEGGVFGGFFFWNGARAGLKSRSESLPSGVPVLFQAGPRLVWDGQAIEGLESERRAARSGVAIDQRGQVILFIFPMSSPVSLAELPSLLSASVETGGVGAQRALNFDGGSSTQFVLRGKKRPLSLPGLAPVPAFLGITPKSGF